MLHVLYAPKGEVGSYLHSKKAVSCYRSGVPNQRLWPCTGLRPIYAQFHLGEQQGTAAIDATVGNKIGKVLAQSETNIRVIICKSYTQISDSAFCTFF